MTTCIAPNLQAYDDNFARSLAISSYCHAICRYSGPRRIVEDRIALSGAPGSPYTRKMLALLRYRRLPYRFPPAEGPALAGLPVPKVRLLPTFYLPGPGGELEAVVDPTPIIRRLEAEHAARSVIPHDPALAFLEGLDRGLRRRVADRPDIGRR